MANKIQIKRSVANGTVTGLSNGELAFTQASNTLFIGLPDGSGVLRIGGAMVPGTLTANQALVANSTSGIDKVVVANLVPTSIWANGSAGSAGQLLTTNGSVAYWSTPPASVAGSDTQVQFNDGGTLGADSGLTFNKTTDTLTTNTVLATSTVNAATLSVGTSVVANSTRLAIGTSVGLDANGTIGTAGQVLHSNGTTVYWATDDQGVTSVATGNGLSGGPITTTGTVSVLANAGIIANSTGVFAAAANGISVTAAGINVLAGTNGGLVSNSTGVWVTAGSGLLTNATGVHVGTGNGVAVSADAIAVQGGSTLTVNATGVHVNSTLNITDLTLTGNLTVLGDLVTMNVATLAVEDSLITLAKDQGSTVTYTDALDIGFVGTYGNTANLYYSGLFRDQSDAGTWKLFTSNGVISNTNVDTANTNAFKLATLQAFLISGGLTTNSTSANLIANSTYAVGIVANSLTLSTALAGTSGGTGRTTSTNNALLVGNSTNGYNLLNLGTDGYVLQSNGTALVYDILDGGVF